MPFSVILTEKGGATQRLDFDSEEITIGRVDENDICLPKGNISKKHTKIVVKDGKIIVLDLKSTNGTYVNGKKLAGPQVITPTDKVYIGDFILNVEPPEAAEPIEELPAEDAEPPPEEHGEPAQEYEGEDATRREAYPPEGDLEAELQPEPLVETAPEPLAEDENIPTNAGVRKPALENAPTALAKSPLAAAKAAAAAGTPPKPLPVKPVPSAPPKKRPLVSAVPAPPPPEPTSLGDYADTLKIVHERLIEALDLRRLDVDAMASEELWQKTEAVIRQIVSKMDQKGELDAHLDREELAQDVLNEALGLGPLEIYLADDTISEIMVNSPTQVFVERNGRLEQVTKAFSSVQAVLGVIERIVAPLGRHIDESSPLVDARLSDGSRVNAIIAPLALKGPCITIRKFKRELLGGQDLIDRGALTEPMAEFLDTCVKVRRNLVISGGTGSGKTTLLNILSGFIPETERIVTIEDAAELQLSQEHWVQLESRPTNIEGKGEITIRDLVRNSLRMRPDRIVIGECRGGEALDMLQAMNTGHDGSLTTLHANSPRDALSRLETMVLMSGMEQDVITMQEIFAFKQEGFDSDGKVQGRFVATGQIPKFYDELQRRGVPVNMDIFRES